jgi:hypothetical protein
MVTLKGSRSTEGEALILSYLTGAHYVHPWWHIEHLTNVPCTRSTVSADGPRWPVRFAAHRQPLCWNFMYQSGIVLSVGTVWYKVRNVHCTVTISSVLANSKTERFLIPCHAMFRHVCPLAVKPASTPRCLVHKRKLGEIPTYWYAAFCYVCLGCCAAEFGISGGTYELLCICCPFSISALLMQF